ncbi:unnamed protein product [Rhizoctonia solani]|uniref:Uncharacterized protein n=1 Tax=Rhizoctonia solani TaxID=456999 RepID=A0A8H2ZYH9_9AGAM|nr:unnamed protein product [Rhizoctonia solani]
MAPTEMFAQLNLDYIDYDPVPTLSPDFEDKSKETEAKSTLRKRKTALPDVDDFEEQGQLLSEYMCPICYCPPQNAVVTPATTTRQAAYRPLCPVCRTPIPNLRFAFPAIEFNLNPNIPLNVMNQYQPPNTNFDNDSADDKWDPARSGVIGLEIMAVNQV